MRMHQEQASRCPTSGLAGGRTVTGSRQAPGSQARVLVPVSSPAGVKPRRVPIQWLVTHVTRARTAMVGPEVPDPGANDPDSMGTNSLSRTLTDTLRCNGNGYSEPSYRMTREPACR